MIHRAGLFLFVSSFLFMLLGGRLHSQDILGVEAEFVPLGGTAAFPIEYSVSISNASPSSVSNHLFRLIFTDGMLPDLNAINSGNPGYTCSYFSNQLSCGPLPELLSGEVLNIQVQCTELNGLPPHTNEVRVQVVGSYFTNFPVVITQDFNRVVSNSLDKKTVFADNPLPIDLEMTFFPLDLSTSVGAFFLRGSQGGNYPFAASQLGSTLTITPQVPSYFPNETVRFTMATNIIDASGQFRTHRYQYDFTAFPAVSSLPGLQFSFGPSGSFDASLPQTVVKFADIDTDGILELVVGRGLDSDGRISIYQRQVSGTYSIIAELVVGRTILDLDVGDVDLDGLMDIAYGTEKGAFLRFYKPTRLPALRQIAGLNLDQPQPAAPDFSAVSVLLFDSNSDGDLDLVSSGYGENQQTPVSLNPLYADPYSNYELTTEMTTNMSSNFDLIDGDLDGDGDLDLGIARRNDDSGGGFRVDIGAGLRIIQSGLGYADQGLDYLEVHAVDILELGYPQLFVLIGSDTNSYFYDLSTGERTELILSKQYTSVQFADMNADGAVDIVGLDSNGTITVELLSGSTTTSIKEYPFDTDSFDLGDADGDGDLDILFGNGAGGAIVYSVGASFAEYSLTHTLVSPSNVSSATPVPIGLGQSISYELILSNQSATAGAGELYIAPPANSVGITNVNAGGLDCSISDEAFQCEITNFLGSVTVSYDVVMSCDLSFSFSHNGAFSNSLTGEILQDAGPTLDLDSLSISLSSTNSIPAEVEPNFPFFTNWVVISNLSPSIPTPEGTISSSSNGEISSIGPSMKPVPSIPPNGSISIQFDYVATFETVDGVGVITYDYLTACESNQTQLSVNIFGIPTRTEGFVCLQRGPFTCEELDSILPPENSGDLGVISLDGPNLIGSSGCTNIFQLNWSADFGETCSEQIEVIVEPISYDAVPTLWFGNDPSQSPFPPIGPFDAICNTDYSVLAVTNQYISNCFHVIERNVSIINACGAMTNVTEFRYGCSQDGAFFFPESITITNGIYTPSDVTSTCGSVDVTDITNLNPSVISICSQVFERIIRFSISDDPPLDVCPNQFVITQQVTDLLIQFVAVPELTTTDPVVPDLNAIWNPCGFFDLNQFPDPGAPFNGTVEVTYSIPGVTNGTVTVIFEDPNVGPSISDCPILPHQIIQSTCMYQLPDLRGLVSVTSFCEPFSISQQPLPGSQVNGPGLIQVELVATDNCGGDRCQFEVMLLCPSLSNSFAVACPALSFQDSDCNFEMPDLSELLDVVSSCAWGVESQSIPMGTVFTQAIPQQVVTVIVTNACGESQACTIPMSLSCDPGADCRLSHAITAPIQLDLFTNQLVQFTTTLDVSSFSGGPVTNEMTYAYDTNHFQYLSSLPPLTDLGGVLVPGINDSVLVGELRYSILFLTLKPGEFTNIVSVSIDGPSASKDLALSGNIIESPYLSVTTANVIQYEPDCLFEIPDLSLFPNLLSISSSPPAGIASQLPPVGSPDFQGGEVLNMVVTVTNAYFSETVILDIQVECASPNSLTVIHNESGLNLGDLELGESFDISITFSNSGNIAVIPPEFQYAFPPNILILDSVTGPPANQTDSNGQVLFEGLPQVDPGQALEWTFTFTAIGEGPFTNTAIVLLPSGDEVTDSTTGNVTIPTVYNTVRGAAWLDYDSNGLRDANEIALAGIRVDVYDDLGLFVSNRITIYNGHYEFSLPEGEYRLEFDYANVIPGVPVDVTRSNLTDPNRNNDVAADGQVFVTNSSPLTVDLGVSFPWADMEFTHSVYAGHDGGVGCPGIAQPTINGSAPVTYCFSVLNTGTAVLSNLVVASTRLGMVQNVSELLPGDSVSFYTEPIATGMLASVASVLAYDGRNDRWLSAIEQAWVVDVSNREIQGRLVRDDNNNGITDPGESGYSGLQLELRNASGQVIQTTASSANGQYGFTGLGPGTYYIRVQLIPGLAFANNSGLGRGQAPVVLTSASLFNVDSYLQPSADSDGDGMPDDWELINGEGSALLDPDADGQNNRDEYLSGTDPLNANSSFMITDMRPLAFGIEIDFQAQATRSYLLEGYSQLNGSWSPLQTDILGVNGEITLMDPIGSQSYRWRKYRIKIQP